MARLPRNEIDAGPHHVWARGVERRLIFLDDDDRLLYLRLLASVAQRFGWSVLAYCLMPNHVHLLIETREPNLGRGMHVLHGQYAQLFNQKHGRVGHLFQSRYGNRLLRDELDVAFVFAYIAANPVAAALCARPEDWQWSSYEASVTVVRHALVDLTRLRDFLHAADTCALAIVRDRLRAEPLSAGPGSAGPFSPGLPSPE